MIRTIRRSSPLLYLLTCHLIMGYCVGYFYTFGKESGWNREHDEMTVVYVLDENFSWSSLERLYCKTNNIS